MCSAAAAASLLEHGRGVGMSDAAGGTAVAASSSLCLLSAEVTASFALSSEATVSAAVPEAVPLPMWVCSCEAGVPSIVTPGAAAAPAVPAAAAAFSAA